MRPLSLPYRDRPENRLVRLAKIVSFRKAKPAGSEKSWQGRLNQFWIDVQVLPEVEICVYTSGKTDNAQRNGAVTFARILPTIMTTDGKLKITFGLLSVGLLTTLLFKLTNVPGGMILSGLFLGGMMIVGIILGCLILTGILKLVFKRTSFLTILFITTTISFSAFHYQLYSPTLTIVVPTSYSGEVDLVLANVTHNILTLDSNGIGYIDQWTFDKTYTRPIVVDQDGNSLDSLLVGFNPTSFWGVGKSCCIDNQKVHTKSFKIKRNSKEDVFKFRILTDLINRKIMKTTKPDKYTFIQTEATTDSIDNRTTK